MNNNHNTTFKKLQQSNTYIPTSPPPSSSSPHLNNNNGEMMKKIWKSCGKKALLKFKLVELKEELRKKSLTLNGNKAEIVERLHEKYMSEEQAISNNTTIDNINPSPESTSNSSSSPAIKSSSLTTPNSNSSINERKSAYLKRNSNSAAVTFAPFSAMNNLSLYDQVTSSPPSSSPPLSIPPPPSSTTINTSSNTSSNTTTTSTTTTSTSNNSARAPTSSNGSLTNSPPLLTNSTSTTTSQTKKSSSLPPPPTLSTLPSSLYNPLFYGSNKGSFSYPKLPSVPLPPYPQYGVPNYNYLNFPMYNPNNPNNTTSTTTTSNGTNGIKKKKKKENHALKPAALATSLATKEEEKSSEVDTDEFLSLEEIECYNSNIDYCSSSDDQTFLQKRCLSDTELYFETFENEALNNLLYASTPHKKKQKQEHEYYDDLFYDRNKELEEEQVIETTNTESIPSENHHVNDIGFRVKCIIDGNTSEEKDVFIRDDKKWEDVVKHLIIDYRSFYKYFNFELVPNDFNGTLHSKCEDVSISCHSTVHSSSISNRDSITITFRVVDHTCRFELQVDSITSLGLQEDEINLEPAEEDGYDQDNEDDDEYDDDDDREESTQEVNNDEEEEVLPLMEQDDLHEQQILLNLIESI